MLVLFIKIIYNICIVSFLQMLYLVFRIYFIPIYCITLISLFTIVKSQKCPVKQNPSKNELFFRFLKTAGRFT